MGDNDSVEVGDIHLGYQSSSLFCSSKATASAAMRIKSTPGATWWHRRSERSGSRRPVGEGSEGKRHRYGQTLEEASFHVMRRKARKDSPATSEGLHNKPRPRTST